MKLICEVLEEVKLITEEKEDGKKDFFIEGIFMQADLKNRNGRIYPMPVMEKEVNRYVKEYVDTKRAFGELGHPEDVEGCFGCKVIGLQLSPGDSSSQKAMSNKKSCRVHQVCCLLFWLPTESNFCWLP